MGNHVAKERNGEFPTLNRSGIVPSVTIDARRQMDTRREMPDVVSLVSGLTA